MELLPEPGLAADTPQEPTTPKKRSARKKDRVKENQEKERDKEAASSEEVRVVKVEAEPAPEEYQEVRTPLSYCTQDNKFPLPYDLQTR